MSNKLHKTGSNKKHAYVPDPNAKNFLLIPLILLIIIVPLVMRLYAYDANMSEFAWFADSETEYDIFLYYRGVILTIIAAVMAFALIIKLMLGAFPSLKKDYWLFFLLGYAVLTFLSTALSDYSYFGFNGLFEQFETVWVILSYCIVTFYTFIIVRTNKDVNIIKTALFVLLVIMCAIGIAQFVGKDFFSSTLGKKLIIPEEHADLRELLNFTFSSNATHQVYLTLYNPNYVGVFTALLLPVTVILIPASKKVISKLLWGVISVLLLICAFGSGSKAFLISLVGVALIAILLYRKYLFRFYIPLLIAVCVFVVTIRGAFAYIGVNPIDYVKKALTITKNDHALQNIEMGEEDVIITYNDTILKVRYLNIYGRFVYEFRDENNVLLAYDKSDTYTYMLSDDTFNGLSFTYYAGFNDYDFIASMKYNGCEVYFTFIEGEGPLYLTPALKPDTFTPSESAVFTNYDRLVSGRGFLWSKTIPLLKDNLILGSGADTFAMQFPHNDYIARLNSGYYNMLITKPHSLYLQIGVQHGVLALICFLVVCMWYIIQSLRLYWKVDFSSKNQLFGVGLMLGVIGYLILGISNDSSVTLAPLFWMIIGLGFAVNKINKNAAEESC